MRSRWEAWVLAGSLGVLAACGSSDGGDADDDAGASGNAANAGRGGGGSANGGATASGGRAGASSAGATSGGSAGSSAGAAGSEAVACMAKTTNHTPGSRLRMQNLVTAEGDRAWNRLYDTELDTPCQFLLANDGTQRCFPGTKLDTTGPYYSDPNCSEQIVSWSSCDTGQYIMLYSQPGERCSERYWSGHALGEALELDTAYVVSSGVCQTVSLGSGTYRKVGPELELATLVKGTETQLPGASRIRGRGVTGEDGSIKVTGWDDTELGAACYFSHFEAEFERCGPFRSAGSTYSDPECTASAVVGDACEPAAQVPPYVRSLSSSDCFEAIASVGAPLASHESYSLVEGVCMRTSETASLFELGETASPSVLGAVTQITLESDPGRLKPMYKTSADGGCWFDDWYDTELETRCLFQRSSKDKYHCHPDSTFGTATVMKTFSDSACTVSAMIARLSACDDEVPSVAFGDYGVTACLEALEAWRTRELIPSPESLDYYLLQGDTCVSATLSAGTRYVTLAGKIEDSELVEGVPTVE